MKSINNDLKEIIEAVKGYIELEALSGGELGGDRSHTKYSEETCPHRDDEETCPRRDNETSPLHKLKKEVLSCTKCVLSKTRRNVVFGAGNSKARLMFVGEAPGMEEDLQGLPFVGRAGELLTRIIESIGLKRKDVYIANILKCRPPGNRDPLPTEILTCEEYIVKQIELIKPMVICALGKFAAQTLLRSQEPITRLRGKFYYYHQARLMPTFHPAYILRNPQDKKFVWEDMKKIKKELVIGGDRCFYENNSH